MASDPFTSSVLPMLPTLVKAPFSNSGWLSESQWDSYRAISLMRKNFKQSGLDQQHLANKERVNVKDKKLKRALVIAISLGVVVWAAIVYAQTTNVLSLAPFLTRSFSTVRPQ